MLVIIQARMNSNRLPGKVLRELYGKPILGWAINRVRSASQIKRIIIATSDHESDDPIEDYCTSIGEVCYRGSLNNVANRFSEILKTEKAEAFVRISGDSPLIDPEIVDYATALYQHTNCDLVTNIMMRTFPKGQSVEVLNSKTFINVSYSMKELIDQEHVTTFYYKNLEKFRVVNFTSGEDAASIQLSVDTTEDLKMALSIFKASRGDPKTWRELLELRNQIIHK
tara:strand:+ start:542 stop:1219 length:678 start_codon:yes stop_codon:yes gene_type:complete